MSDHYKKSADAYANAAKIYYSINWSMTESMALWFAGGLYNDSGNKNLGCHYLEKSLKAFRMNSIDQKQFKNPESMPKRVKENKLSINVKY